MCGIMGYAGTRLCKNTLVGGLKDLEYRGYDSAGVAISSGGSIHVCKKKGRISELYSALHTIGDGYLGIGHTRWATHGAPSDINSHPHVSHSGLIAVVHNGIIENYLQLKESLTKTGFRFSSETDTEVIAQLIESLYNGDLFDAVCAATPYLSGSFAFCAMSRDEEYITAVCRGNPVIVAECEDGVYISSDVTALLGLHGRYFRLLSGQTARISKDGAYLYDSDMSIAEKHYLNIDWEPQSAKLNGSESFMLKEIMEIPAAITKTLAGFYVPKELSGAYLNRLRSIYLIGCGTAYHAALIGKAAIEAFARIPCECDLASEFRYRDPIAGRDNLCIFISQSGETADTLAALMLAKERGARTVALTNVRGSSISHYADITLYTSAGPEIAVASTKAYNSQLAALYALALEFGLKTGRLDSDRHDRLNKELCRAAQDGSMTLYPDIPELANVFKACKSVIFIGRGQDNFVASEASLKLKEVSYINSEAYAAGELKHGTLALIEEGSPVIVFLCSKELLDKTVNAINEVKARGAQVLAIGNAKYMDCPLIDYKIAIPNIADEFAPLYSIIPAQLFAYYMAVKRGCDPDKPRNLAKSVTVE